MPSYDRALWALRTWLNSVDHGSKRLKELSILSSLPRSSLPRAGERDHLLPR